MARPFFHSSADPVMYEDFDKKIVDKLMELNWSGSSDDSFFKAISSQSSYEPYTPSIWSNAILIYCIAALAILVFGFFAYLYIKKAMDKIEE